VASSTSPPELAASGERVHVRTVRAEDVEPYHRAVLASAERMRRWNPVNPNDLPHHIAAQSADHRTFLVFANEPEPGQPVVGRINLNGVVRGRLRSVAIGYDAYDPYAGRGLFAEGLRLVVDLALAPATAGGLDLHRVEASVQPGNTRSAGLLRSLGFHHEGFSPRLLYLPDDEQHEAWRDHDRYAVTREEWPAAAYASREPAPVVVLMDTAGTERGAAWSRAVARELALPVLPATLAAADLTAILANCTAGAVVAGALSSPQLQHVPRSVREIFPGALLAGAGTEVDGGADWDGVDARSVTRAALALRAAARTGT
jgi:ribosomal-protein-alanine N-acetyltransferase